VRLETLPLIAGLIVGMIGLGFLADAWLVEDAPPPHPDRRRRIRVERNRRGEAILGIGMLCIAAAFLGRDTWRYTNVVVIAGILAITVGALYNRVFLRELLVFRGAARRAEPPAFTDADGTGGSARPRPRIR
jgi:hypothetical protein